MKMLAYALLDTKTGSYGVPFFVSHEGIARRMVSDLVADRSTSINRHPADFSLYCVGAFELTSGKLFSEASPVFVANCVEYVPAEKVVLNAGIPFEKEL